MFTAIGSYDRQNREWGQNGARLLLNGNRPQKRPLSTVELGISTAIVLCLVAIAIGVFRQQYAFNPAVLVARTGGTQKTEPLLAATRPEWLPTELEPFGPPEYFNPANLYDKIDGKSELYLSAGFVRMDCRRFALKQAPDQWLEWFVYQMASPTAAFSVYSGQRRAEAQNLNWAQFAYQTRNSIYFISGSNYVEAVAASTNAALMQALTALARGYVQAAGTGGAGAGRLPQMDQLPAENLVPGSYALQSADVFGFDRFKNVFTAQYAFQEGPVMGFVTSCPSPEAAAALRDAYRAFLLENGGQAVQAPGAGDADKPIQIMDGIELVFSAGNKVAGVHAAPGMESAQKLAARLHQHLASHAK